VLTPEDFDLTAADSLRAAFREHASGVTIVTAVDLEGKPVGFTASSVTSLGSNPPLVSFNVAQGASFYDVLCQPEAKVALHMLSSDNLELAQRLSGDREQRFEADNWQRGPHNLPIFHGTPAVLIGQIRRVVEIERNAVVIVDALMSKTEPSKAPLIYFQRGYLAGGERLTDNF
jgi:flavin reductase (DIM6/NTAB) family NADH-FMN oxidoreductase RutF